MKNRYITVRGLGQGIYEEKKSEFIANVKPISSEKEAIDFINEMKSKYYDARHNVYAYYVEEDGVPYQRYSDDGEPSGTSGIPTLEAFRKKNIQDVCVVVTRYFGGTLLGAAGLIRAYGKACSLGIENARIIERKKVTEVATEVDYSLSGKLQNYFHQENIIIKETDYGVNVKFILLCDVDEVENLCNALIDLTNACVTCITGDTYYIDT